MFSPWQGRIKQVFVKAGDEVRRGAVLFSIESPDLVQAELNLIVTSGLLQLTTKAQQRAQGMIETSAIAQKDLDQAISDQQSAEANQKAARDAVRIFGKSEVEMEAIVASRKTDGELRITSPLTGQVTALSAFSGLLVQPGTAPAPVTVADLSAQSFRKLPFGRRAMPPKRSLPPRPGALRLLRQQAAFDYDARTLTSANAAEAAVKVTFDFTRRQLDARAVNALAMISAEQAYQLARIGRIQSQATRYTGTALLFQALGGSVEAEQAARP